MKDLKPFLLERKNIKKEVTGSISADNYSRLKFGLVDYDDIPQRFNSTEWLTTKATSPAAKTEVQEKFTAFIFNSYKENLDKMEEDLTIDSLPYSLKIDKENKLWLDSAKGQVRTIVEFLQKDGWNISNLIASHYLEDNPIARNIMVLHSSLSGTLNNRPKDAIDPSDIIIYDKTHARQINKWQDSLMSWGGLEKEFLNQYQAVIKYLISKKWYVGISLKKGNNFTAHYNNYKEAPDVYSDIEITDIRKTAQNLNINFSAYNETKNKKCDFGFRLSNQGQSHVSLELEAYKNAQGGKGTWAILDVRKENSKLEFDDDNRTVKYPKIKINKDWDQKLVNDFLDIEHPINKSSTKSNHILDIETFNIFKYIISNDKDNVISLMHYCAKIGPESAPYLMVSPN